MTLPWNLKSAFIAACLIALFAGITTVSQAQILFFSTSASIEYSDLDGANRKSLTTIASNSMAMVDLSVDPQSRTVYWALYEPMLDEVIFFRAATNSKRTEELFRVANAGDFRSIAVDGMAEKIYWARSTPTNAIQRADLDGSNVETLVENTGFGLFGLVIEPEFNAMYWTSYTNYQNNGTIHRATLDGENADSLVTRRGWPVDIAIDRAAGKIYWADFFHNAVKRANLMDGSNVESVVEGIGNPIGITLDPQANKVYWVDTTASKLMWADLDGQNASNLTNVADPRRLGILLEKQVGVSETSWSDLRQRYR